MTLEESLNFSRERLLNVLNSKEVVQTNEDGMELCKRIIPIAAAEQIQGIVDILIHNCTQLHQYTLAYDECIQDYIGKKKVPESYDQFSKDFIHKMSSIVAAADSKSTDEDLPGTSMELSEEEDNA